MTEEEIRILTEAKEANPHWFSAVIHSAEIMIQRRKKYAGANHPYWNFVDMAYRNREPIEKVFRNYINIKASRLTASIDEDFEDEKVLDTFLDVGNYGLIAAGWFLDGLTLDDVYPVHEWFEAQPGDEYDET